MCCMAQKLTTAARPKPPDSSASVRSSEARSRSPVHSASATPEAPNPSSAVEMTRKPKWYQRATESTRVSASSRSRVAKEMTRIPM